MLTYSCLGGYEGLAAAGVDVHDGAGDPDRKAALVSEERDPDTYYGFWTRTPERVDTVDAYLRETYPA